MPPPGRPMAPSGSGKVLLILILTRPEWFKLLLACPRPWVDVPWPHAIAQGHPDRANDHSGRFIAKIIPFMPFFAYRTVACSLEAMS